MSRKLIHDDALLLQEVIAKRRSDLLPVVARIGSVPLSNEERESLREVLCEEICEHELDKSSEPTTRGKMLDDLIGKLATL